MTMRIGIDARMYGAEACTGIGQYIQQLTTNLFEIDKKNQYVLFLLPAQYENFICPNERVHKVKITAPWYSYAEQIKLPFQLRGQKLDLIHYPHFNSPLFFFKKSICTIHDLTPFKFDGHKMKSKFRKLAHRLIFLQTIKKAQKILTVSENTRDAIISQFKVKNDKIIVTHLGVDERFSPNQKNGIINDIKSKHGLSKPYIFFVGAWRNHKNLEGLISAFELLKKNHNIPHQLVLGGQEDVHYPNISQKINASKYRAEIITPGFISNEELPLFYQNAELFVLPSFIEGFGIIALEAQACGCPVASTNTSCMPEILQNSANYFDPHNTEEMAQSIYDLLTNSNLKDSLIAKGFKNVARYSWKNCAQQTLDTYNQILNK